jgi:hypothetical protein
MFRVRSVVHRPHATVGLDQAVLTFHPVTFPLFPLLLYVTGMQVFYSVLEYVTRPRLQKNKKKHIKYIK